MARDPLHERVESEWRAHAEAERALERELDESRARPRVARPIGHRLGYSVPLVVVVSAICALLSYLIASIAAKFDAAPAYTYVLCGFAIAVVAWGATGISRVRASARDRLYDAAVAITFASLLRGILQPSAFLRVFDAYGPDEHALVVRMRGFDSVPPFFEVVAWAATLACALVVVASLVRIALDRRWDARRR